MSGLLLADIASSAHAYTHAPSTLEVAATQERLETALKGCDDGELFFEYCHHDKLVWSEGKVKSASCGSRRGMGLRAIQGASCFFAHGSALTPSGLEDLILGLAIPCSGQDFSRTENSKAHLTLFSTDDPLETANFAERIAFVAELDALARQNPLVADVTIILSSEWQAISGLRPYHLPWHDHRPRTELSISVTLKRNEVRSSGSDSLGGREGFARIMANGQQVVKNALAQAEIMLEAKPCQAGQMDVLLGSGWTGILLHEAIGHGLEGDFNRKQTSVFSALMGQRIASKGVTVLDNGTVMNHRGSLHVDDEGTKTQATTLIEDGVLVGYMQDRHNARLMGTQSTGNGRRQSYAHLPMPRMTNTYMQSGTVSQQDMLSEVKEGIYAVSFGGGSVDITSGQFVFNCTEAYLIRNGMIEHPVQGASIIGMGAEALRGIRHVGDDFALDAGMGVCGKEGQWVPVGVGQPSLLISGLNVGGSEKSS